MIVEPTALDGVFLVHCDRISDARGHFSRSYCRAIAANHGLNTDWPQHNLSYNATAATLRGMHWQAAPHEEVKFVRCVAGAVFDVAVDIRADSPTRGRWVGYELSAENQDALYIGRGFAHGFITLQDASTLYYLMGAAYCGEAASCGIMWDDPTIGIDWPMQPVVMSPRDQQLPAFNDL